jgi:hypothetical protein
MNSLAEHRKECTAFVNTYNIRYSLLAKQLKVSQEILCSTELVFVPRLSKLTLKSEGHKICKVRSPRLASPNPSMVLFSPSSVWSTEVS